MCFADKSSDQKTTRRLLRAALALAAALATAVPSHAIVGGGAPSTDGVARSVVVITGARGNVCSGALIAPDIVLTAAHCVVPGSTYRVIDGNIASGRQIQATAALHPNFNLQTMLAHRATADVALLRLSQPLGGKTPTSIGVPRVPITQSVRFTVAGIGVTSSGSESGLGTVRVISLGVTGQPGGLQIRLVDPVTQNTRAGLGACTGDSGAPVFEDQGAPILVGVVSLSTGANNAAGCGGLTIVTPLTLYRDWILKTARAWGAKI
jgi:hypothetical protein